MILWVYAAVQNLQFIGGNPGSSCKANTDTKWTLHAIAPITTLNTFMEYYYSTFLVYLIIMAHTKLLKQWSKKTSRIVCSFKVKPASLSAKAASLTHLKKNGKWSGSFLNTWIPSKRQKIDNDVDGRMARSKHWKSSLEKQDIWSNWSLTSQAGTFSLNFSLTIQQTDMMKAWLDNSGV